MMAIGEFVCPHCGRQIVVHRDGGLEHALAPVRACPYWALTVAFHAVRNEVRRRIGVTGPLRGDRFRA